jgi:hypothetical protein
MQKVKLVLSEEELRIVSDPGIILTKNAIIKKVYDLFGILADEQIQFQYPGEAGAIPPKISRGENYKGLPYVVLDYPRLFTSEHVFAIRTHFWWGNYFSVTLHLKGQFQQTYQDKLSANFEALAESGHLICLATDEWEHELREPYFTNLRSMGFENYQQALVSMPFLKIAKPFPLYEWSSMVDLLREEQRTMTNLLS